MQLQTLANFKSRNTINKYNLPQANSKFYSLCLSGIAISPVVIVKQVCGLAEVSGLNGDDADPKLRHFLPHGAAETFKGVLGSAVD